jgi:hypothetical protein
MQRIVPCATTVVKTSVAFEIELAPCGAAVAAALVAHPRKDG